MHRPSAVRQDHTAELKSARLPVARPLLPRARAIAPYLEEIDAARWYSNFGPLLNRFEARLTERMAPGARVVTVANGTQALALTLNAMGLHSGLVAMPSWTFVATAHAVMQAGLIPWLLDVDPDSWMLDPAMVKDHLAAAPGPVRAVLPVAPFGQMPNLRAWEAFREDTGIAVLIDGAAAFDDAVEAVIPIVVSLHATKTLGVGEGGYLATDDAVLATRVQDLTTYGFRGDRISPFAATNAKLSEYAAAVGLAGLDGWPALRLRYGLAAQKLRMAMLSTPQVAFQPGWGSRWVSSVCVVRLPDGCAGTVAARLAAEGVETRQWWGAGCHLNPAFSALPRGDLRVTQTLANSTLGLPYWADMADREVTRLADAMGRALASSTS